MTKAECPACGEVLDYRDIPNHPNKTIVHLLLHQVELLMKLQDEEDE